MMGKLIYEDLADEMMRLRTENATLRAEVARLNQSIDTIHAVSENRRKMFEDAHNEGIRLREAGDWIANEILRWKLETPDLMSPKLFVDEFDRRRAGREEG